MRALLFCLVILITTASCKKDPIDAVEFWECHQAQSLDSADIVQKIAGSWKWKYQECMWAGGKKADKNLVVTFSSSGSYTVREGSTITSQGTFSVRSTGYNGWQLDLSNPADYLFIGEVFFCGNELLFSNKPVDGCDNLFERL